MCVTGRHAGDPKPLGGEASQRLRERSRRQRGRCSSIRKRFGPKALSSRRATAAAPAASPLPGPRDRAVASAARQADEPLRMALELVDRKGGGSGSR